MADRSLLDPFGLIAALAAQIDKVGNQAGVSQLKSSDASRALNRLLVLSLGAQQLSRKAQQRAFEALNLPTRADLLEVGQRLQAIDEKLMALTELLQHAGVSGVPVPTPPAMPPRTRKAPPSAAASQQAAPAAAATPPKPAARRVRRKAAS